MVAYQEVLWTSYAIRYNVIHDNVSITLDGTLDSRQEIGCYIENITWYKVALRM